MIALRGDAVRGLRPGRPLPGLWTVILAAGGARRFGRHKLLQRLGTRSLLARAVACADAVTPGRCIVVLGCAATLLRRELRDKRVRIIVNRRWRDGMAGSLRSGVAALPPSAQAAMVVLADQFAVQPADLRRLAAAWSHHPSRPACAEYECRVTAPAILPHGWFARAMDLQGDEGARRLLRDPAASPTRVPMTAAGLDLDGRDELSAFRRHARRTRLRAIGQGSPGGVYSS